MEFDSSLSEIHVFKNLFDQNVNDEFGASVLANEIEDMIAIGMRLREVEVGINIELNRVDMELGAIRGMVPIC